jgi:hypothetical protein
MRITANHPVRRAISELPDYYSSKGAAAGAIIAACAVNGIRADPVDMPGAAGHVRFALHPENNAHVICDVCAEKEAHSAYDNFAILPYYTMGMEIECCAYIS